MSAWRRPSDKQQVILETTFSQPGVSEVVLSWGSRGSGAWSPSLERPESGVVVYSNALFLGLPCMKQQVSRVRKWGEGVNPGKPFEILSAKSCILSPSGLRNWSLRGPNMPVSKLVTETYAWWNQQSPSTICSSASKVGEAVADSAPHSKAPVPDSQRHWFYCGTDRQTRS